MKFVDITIRNIFIILAMLLHFPVLLVHADIEGGHHDFSDEPWASTQLCIVCHAGHNTAQASLWNHQISQANYILYESSYGAHSEQPGMNSVTRFCLSCHDGTVPIDSFGNRQGSKYIEGSIGTNLNNHHPVSVEYNSNLVWHLKDPSSPSGQGGTIEEDLLRNGMVECISCHNPHNETDPNELCLSCHQM
ncbi:MAG: cytochrome c3 family protein [Chlamydiota bacterium]|nr:cytochrome c3 family protein [Chlamydiota bacterium]